MDSSHLVVIVIPADQIEKVEQILERLSHYRNWFSHIYNFSSSGQVMSAAAQCMDFMSAFQSSMQVSGSSGALLPQQDVSLLFPDYPDIPSSNPIPQ